LLLLLFLVIRFVFQYLTWLQEFLIRHFFCFSHSCIEFCAFIADLRSLESFSQHKRDYLATLKWASKFTFSDTCCSRHLGHFASKVQHVYTQANTKQGSFKTANHRTIFFLISSMSYTGLN